MLRTLSLLVTLSFVLTGCPAPPDETTQPGQPSGPGGGGPGGPGGPGGGENPPSTGEDGGGDGGGGGGGGGGSMVIALNSHQARMTQEEIQESDYITLSGKVTGDCDGMVQLEAIEEASGPVDADDDAVLAGGPLAVITRDGPGAYSMALPKGSSVRLVSFCDGDDDGNVSTDTEEDAIGEQKLLKELEEDTADVDLSLSGWNAATEDEVQPIEGEEDEGERGPADPGEGPAPGEEPKDGDEGPPEGEAPEGEPAEGAPPKGDPNPAPIEGEVPEGEPPPPGAEGAPPPEGEAP